MIETREGIDNVEAILVLGYVLDNLLIISWFRLLLYLRLEKLLTMLKLSCFRLCFR